MYREDTLAGKKILVTGGGSGLGLAMATRCLEVGADCVICGRTQERLEQARAGLPPELQSRLSTSVCDVRDPEAVDEMIESLWPLDGLINNAAGNFYCCSEDLSPNGFKTVVDIVLHGTFHCSLSFGKRAISSGVDGAILNIVTTYADTGSAFVLPSASAKGGVLAMTKSLGVEWAQHGVRVNAIAPGPIPTDGAWKRLVPSEDVEKKLKNTVPMRRFGTPEELGNLAVFLLSPLSSYMTGECVALDGGEGLQGSGFNLLDQLMPREELRKIFQQMKASR